MNINSLLGRIRVVNKLRISIVLATTIIMGIQFSSAHKLKQTMTTERQIKAITLVESLSSQLNTIAVNSELTLEQKQIAAKNLINGTRFGDAGYFFVFDLDGQMITHPIKPELNGSNMIRHQKRFIANAFSAFVDTANRQGQGFVRYQWPKPGSSEQEEKVSFVQRQSHWGWVLGTGIYLADIEKNYNDALYWILLESLFYIVMLTVISQYVARNITKPLHKLTRTMHQVANNKDLTIALKHQGQDELAEMGKAFNESNRQFRNVICNIADNTMSLASQAEELSVVTQQIKGGINQQHQETASVQEKLTNLDNSATQVLKQSHLTLEAVGQTSNLSKQGITLLKDNTNTIEKVADSVESASDTVAALQHSSNKITEVLDVIKQVADQTNLLALNAAIEAARAGEHGRGFAVVADEVRTLALRTQTSTEHIEEIINEVRQGVRSTVAEMANCKHFATRGLTLSLECDKTLQEIDNAVIDIESANKDIATAAQHQNRQLCEVVSSMTSIATISEQTEMGAEQTHASSQQLSEMSQELSQLVSEFRV